MLSCLLKLNIYVVIRFTCACYVKYGPPARSRVQLYSWLCSSVCRSVVLQNCHSLAVGMMCEACLRGNCTVYFSSYYYKWQHLALINRGYRVCSCFIFYRYSVILLTVVDHRYCFRYMNAGAPGRRHDAYVYGRSWLCQKIERGLLSFPVAIIEHYPVKTIILCGQAFPLTENLLKPFPSV